MAKMDLAVIYQKPRTSQPHPENRVYPYLLRGLAVTRPDQVWCTDVTYIPMRRGFLYLVAIMDWYSRWVLSWRLSNTLEPSFCLRSTRGSAQQVRSPGDLQYRPGESVHQHGVHGTTQRGRGAYLDGRERPLDGQRLHRASVGVHSNTNASILNAFETGSEARQGIGHWIDLYNSERPHSAHAGATPEEVYTDLKKHSERDLALRLAPSQNFPYWRQQELRSPP